MKNTITALIDSLEKKFGPLTIQANHCAEDFHENYEEFIYGFQSGNLTIVTSPFMLATKIPISKYSSYKIFAGVSTLLGILGVILVFFYWKIAILLLLISFLFKIISRYKKNKMALDFSNEILMKLDIDEYDGFFDVVQYYIAGIIQIRSDIGTAHLPLLPSVALTGVKQFAQVR